MLKQPASNYFLFLLSLLIYIFIGYYVQRYETIDLLTGYFILFAIFGYICIRTPCQINFWIFSGLIFRVTLLFAWPALSDDFYRFIWDGRLMAAGYHPFAEVPSYYLQHTASLNVDPELYEKLNSKNYFTIYPPVAQFIFWLSVKLSPESIYGSVLVMRMIIIAFETGSVIIMQKILRHLNLPSKNILLYALNPLVILELTGNLHFEGIMIFFLLLSVLLLIQNRSFLSASFFAFSVCTKLLPLMFLPLLIRQLGLKRACIYYIVFGLVTLLLFLPLYDPDIITGFSRSLGYYFQKFEFNASIYYLIREWGLWYYGYNIIQTAGWQLGVMAAALILVVIALHIKNKTNDLADIRFFTSMMWCLFIFFLFTTTLHPWYITLLLAISIFTNYRFTVIWTALIFLTYAGYSSDSFQENLWLIAFEYLALSVYMGYELLWRKNPGH